MIHKTATVHYGQSSALGITFTFAIVFHEDIAVLFIEKTGTDLDGMMGKWNAISLFNKYRKEKLEDTSQYKYVGVWGTSAELEVFLAIVNSQYPYTETKLPELWAVHYFEHTK